MAHLDLKLDNLLISDDYNIKLCDFGLFEYLPPIASSKVTKNLGTDGYKAPEIYFQPNKGFDADKADIFSLGVILFLLVFKVPPFKMAT